MASNLDQPQSSAEQANFHVCVRIKPTNNLCFENQGHIEGQKYIRAGPDNSILLVQPHSTQGDQVFIFDEVFDSKTQTISIFNQAVLPTLEDSLFKGFSHTILVYGMTGSGKTFTMFGDNFEETMLIQDNTNVKATYDSNQQQDASPNYTGNEGGIVFQTVKYVLNQKKKTRIKMSYLEIYNESIRDLLSNESSAENLNVVEDAEKGVYCPQQIEKLITNIEQIQQLIKQGNKRRIMASTKMNQFSSRSHAIIQLNLEIETSKNSVQTNYMTPKLYMVDLAGSERASATSESKNVRQKEGSNINKSLLSLGNCINILSQNDKSKRHVPYRDSKLTRLLKESLGGNAKTLFIACVTPAFKFIEETINTLKYAQRAKTIKKEVYENLKSIYNTEKLQGKNYLDPFYQQEPEIEQQLTLEEQLLQGVSEKINNLKETPPTTEEILTSQQYQNNRYTFMQNFNRLTLRFEDALQKKKEIEYNLKEQDNLIEQNEKNIQELQESLLQINMTQKDSKFRNDKIEQLKNAIQNSKDYKVKLQQKDQKENQKQIEIIRQQLQELYEVDFIIKCQTLTNYQLYIMFEEDKKKLEEKYASLMHTQEAFEREEIMKDAQIQKLKEEISNLRSNPNQNLENSKASNKSRDKSKGKVNSNTRSSMSLTNNQKNTPRSMPQANGNKNYLQNQMYVPSNAVSVQAVRNSFNQSNNRQSGQEAQDDYNNYNNDQQVSPNKKELDKYIRKSQIIESQLKPTNNNSSKATPQQKLKSSNQLNDQSNDSSQFLNNNNNRNSNINNYQPAQYQQPQQVKSSNSKFDSPIKNQYVSPNNPTESQFKNYKPNGEQEYEPQQYQQFNQYSNSISNAQVYQPAQNPPGVYQPNMTPQSYQPIGNPNIYQPASNTPPYQPIQSTLPYQPVQNTPPYQPVNNPSFNNYLQNNVPSYNNRYQGDSNFAQNNFNVGQQQQYQGFQQQQQQPQFQQYNPSNPQQFQYSAYQIPNQQQVAQQTGQQQQKPTVGIDFICKTIQLDNKTLRLQLWDTAGQERFKSLIPSYIRDSNAAIIVYDITNQSSFNNLNKWIEEVKEERGNDALIFVLGNKADLDERKVTVEEANQSLKQFGLQVQEVSAKSGLNIATFFKQLAQALNGGPANENDNKNQQQQQNSNQQQQQQQQSQGTQLKNPNQSQQDKDSKKSGCC